MINKETLMFGSFAREARNKGCRLFNTSFKYYDLNAIYKSFSINNIEDAIKAAKTLNFKGFAITMPFKIKVLDYVDEMSEDVVEIGAANTIINKNGKLKAYNTDFLAAKEFIPKYYRDNNHLYILGNGGYAAAVKYAAKILNISYNIITRKNWDIIGELRNCLIYNCTPVSNIIDWSNTYIDCRVETRTGKELSWIQASHQFKLYTGREFPLKFGENNGF